MTSCARLDVYINHQMGNQLPRIDTSITRIRNPSNPTRCSSMENDSVKKVCLSTGLGNKGEIIHFKALLTRSYLDFSRNIPIFLLATIIYIMIVYSGQDLISLIYPSTLDMNR